MSITIRVTYWRLVLLCWAIFSAAEIIGSFRDIGTMFPASMVTWRDLALHAAILLGPALIGFMAGRDSGVKP
jgi:hypothetical protein